MNKKVVGVQRELNEIAEELVRRGFDVTSLLDTEKILDAIVYYNDTSDVVNEEGFENAMDMKKVLKINAAKNNIDQIVTKINDI